MSSRIGAVVFPHGSVASRIGTEIVNLVLKKGDLGTNWISTSILATLASMTRDSFSQGG